MKIQSGFSIKPESPEERQSRQEGQLRDASKMYENYFLNEMVKAMRSTVQRDGGVMKQNFAEQIFEQQLDQQYVEGWTQKGGVGLADMIYDQIHEKFLGGSNKEMPKGMLPISPKRDSLGVPNTDSLQMKALPPGPQSQLEYRFEVPHPGAGHFDAQSPMSGKVTETQTLGEGWNLVRLDHGQGLRSELTFPGSMAEIGTGQEVAAGQKLGTLDSGRPVLAWKLDWT